MNAISALQLLTEGNARFAAGRMIHPHTDADRRAEVAREGQHPFATVLTCADSRVPAEIVFDRGIGDIFVVCVAGNVVGPSELGSVEYAVDHLATPVVLVLGHSLCGAVQATLSRRRSVGQPPADRQPDRQRGPSRASGRAQLGGRSTGESRDPRQRLAERGATAHAE